VDTLAQKPQPDLITCWLHYNAAQRISHHADGITTAKPQDEAFYDEYKTAIKTVMKEYHLEDPPIMYNLNFGHTEPKMILPYGAMAEIDCESGTFSILESGVK